MLAAYLIVTVAVISQCQPIASTAMPKGYILNRANGHGYKLKYGARPWHVAQQKCEEDGGYLAAPRTQDEFQFLQRLVKGMYLPHVTDSSKKILVWLGINNLDDHKVWINSDGVNIESTGFHKWSSDQDIAFSSSNPSEPHCAAMDARNTGLRAYWCHLPLTYMCEIQ